MITKYFLGGNFGEGFITHEDQEQQGLSFQCHPDSVTVVQGEDLQISAWVARTKVTEVSKEIAQAKIDAAIASSPATEDLDKNSIPRPSITL